MAKKIWIINQNSYLPEDGPHTRHFVISKYLAADGYEPYVFACNELHHAGKRIDTGKEDYIEREKSGVKFFYVKSHHYKKNDINRIFNITSFYFKMFSVAKQIERKYGKPDIIYASTMYPTALLLGTKLAKKYGIKCISETRDIVPEGFVTKGTFKENGIIAKLARAFMKNVYYKSDALVFTMSGGQQYIKDMGWDKDHGGKINLESVYYINNGVDKDEFDLNAEKNVIEDDDLSDPGIFKVVYFGAIRFMNNMPLYIDTARELKRRGKNNIKLLLWGTGNKMDEMQKVLDEEGLDNIVLKGFVDKKYIPGISRRADLFIGSGNGSSTDRYGASFNKLFDYYAGQKPIVLLATLSDSMVEGNGCGVELGSNPDFNKVADQIIRFSEMPKDEYEQYCKNSEKMASIYDYKVLAKQVERIIGDLI